ncbi:hypothetical protein GF406_22575 [candidate division KSB1 bacterium]|nr:hypothetical protein [candidate division KSB1 bacterium]
MNGKIVLYVLLWVSFYSALDTVAQIDRLSSGCDIRLTIPTYHDHPFRCKIASPDIIQDLIKQELHLWLEKTKDPWIKNLQKIDSPGSRDNA